MGDQVGPAAKTTTLELARAPPHPSRDSCGDQRRPRAVRRRSADPEAFVGRLLRASVELGRQGSHPAAAASETSPRGDPDRRRTAGSGRTARRGPPRSSFHARPSPSGMGVPAEAVRRQCPAKTIGGPGPRGRRSHAAACRDPALLPLQRELRRAVAVRAPARSGHPPSPSRSSRTVHSTCTRTPNPGRSDMGTGDAQGRGPPSYRVPHLANASGAAPLRPRCRCRPPTSRCFRDTDGSIAINAGRLGVQRSASPVEATPSLSSFTSRL